MKNCLSLVALFGLAFIPMTLFSQQATDKDYRHFIGFNMAPAVGQLVDGTGSGTTIGFGYKYKLNDQYKLRLMTQFERDPLSYNASYFAFTDTLLTFLSRGTHVQDWRVSAGFEKGKFNNPFYLYWGVQAAFGIKETAYQHDLAGYLASSDFTALPILAGSGLALYDVDYTAQNDTIEFTTNLKQSRIALGVPMGVGIKILKHVELQVELTTELSYTDTDYTKERFQSKDTRVVNTHSVDFDVRQFQILLGWKF
ncbi:MAG: hypothetical protein ACKVOK_03995 [Flavobacteriales bacterium]